jgi:hypothetical protein
VNLAARRRLSALQYAAFNQDPAGAHVVLHHERWDVNLRAIDTQLSHLGAGW